MLRTRNPPTMNTGRDWTTLNFPDGVQRHLDPSNKNGNVDNEKAVGSLTTVSRRRRRPRQLPPLPIPLVLTLPFVSRNRGAQGKNTCRVRSLTSPSP